MTIERAVTVAFGVGLLLVGIIAGEGIIKGRQRDAVIDSLQTTIKLKENMAKEHELKAIQEGKRAAQFFIKANKLNDSINLVDNERLKYKRLYESSIRNPLRFTRDTQRDSILAVLYPR